jgi:hypothetical protein
MGEREARPDAREGQAGCDGVTEGLVVPMKPGNAGGGKRPWFRISARQSEGLEIGQPINSREYPEASDGAACQSEG